MNHLTEVAELVARATGGEDIDVLVAAIMHDTVEDTETTGDEMRAAFGPRVAELAGRRRRPGLQNQPATRAKLRRR